MGVPLKKRGKDLTPAQRATIWAYHLEGYSPLEITLKTPHPRSTITRFIQRHAESGSNIFETKPRSGRPQKVDLRG